MIQEHTNNIKNTDTQYEQFMRDEEFQHAYAVEGLITDVGELIAELMVSQQVNKAELAQRLGKSRAYVTQLLSGSRNMTIRTLAEVAYKLGAKVKLRPEYTSAVITHKPAKKLFELPRRGSQREYEVADHSASGGKDRSQIESQEASGSTRYVA